MAKSFNVPCPSCEADVLVKNDSLIGKKIDCPKCKYRFKVPNPKAGADEDDTPTKEIAASKPKGKPNKKLLIGVGAGVAAVAILGVVAFLMFSEDDPKPKATTVQRPVTPPQPVQPVEPMKDPEDNGNNPPMNPDQPMNPMPMPMGNNDVAIAPPIGIAPPANPNAGTTTTAPKVDLPVPVPAKDMKDPTNLLPDKTQAVLHLNMQRLQQTPIYSSFFDRQTLDFFRTSMHFEATDITQIVLALVGADREPFAVIRTKVPVQSLNGLYGKMQLETGKLSPIKGRAYAQIKPNTNPFITAISKVFSTESLLGQAGLPVNDEDRKRWNSKMLSICVYDSQTVIIAETGWLESFLDDLGENGYPRFLSELTPKVAPPPPPSSGDGESPMGSLPAPMGSAPGPMGSAPPRPMGVDSGSPGSPGPGGPPGPPGSGGPGGPPGPPGAGGPGGGFSAPKGNPGGAAGPAGGAGGPAAPKGPPQLYTSIPNFRTIKPELKRMINRLEEDEKNPAAILYADILDKRVYNRDFQSLSAVAGLLVGAVIEHTQIFGAAIKSFQKEKFAAELVFEFVSAEDAKTTANEKLEGLLKTLASLVSKPLGTQIAVNNTAARAGGGGSGPGFPGAGGLGSVGSEGPSTGEGPAAGGPTTLDDTTPGGSPPIGPGGPGSGLTPGGRRDKASFIEIDVADVFVSVETEIFWNSEAFTNVVQPAIASAGTQIKGRMVVLSGATKQHDLAGPLKKLLDEKQMVPPSTMQRATDIDRFGLPYPPDHRVSFMADLLPFLGRGGLRQSIQEKRYPWYHKEHEAAAGTWVSEFLVPYYPQSSWRATHPLGEGRSFGGTNYVGMSGLGLDSARYDPSNPEHAKKVGMTGYDWGSKFSDVTDGLSNTVYMIQVPPTHSRPWIAGGGATVQGVDENLANPVEDFIDPLGKKRGTHILMGDGSVRFVPDNIDPNVFKALVTRAGGEKIDDINKHAPLVDGPKTETVELKGGGANPFRSKPKTEPKSDQPK